MDSTRIADFLVGLPENDFVLHGSPYYLSMLEPRQAECGSGMPSNNLCAIYASVVIECALLRALVRGNDHAWGWRFYGKDAGDQQGFIVEGEGLRLGPGYLYVLPREEFTQVEGTLWWVAVKPVMPTLRVLVEPPILDRFSGIFFKSSIASCARSGK